MRRIPVDTTSINFVVAEEPRPVTDFESKQRKTTENGEPLTSVKLLVQGSSEISIITVKTPGIAEGIKVQDPVRITGLVAQAWTNNGRAAMAFAADRIESTVKAKAV